MAMNITEKQYITKQELCQICNISESTAYKLLKIKKLNFEKCCDGLLHYYKISLCEVREYMREQAEKGHYSERQKEMISLYYRLDPLYNTGNKVFIYDNCFVNSDYLSLDI